VSDIFLGTRGAGDAPVPPHLAHLAWAEPVGIPEDQLRVVRWVGSPGEGKTQAMGLTLEQCIARGWGGLVLDPKGELATNICRRTRFHGHIIYVAPGLTPRRWALNFLELDRTHPRYDKIAPLVAANAVAMFEHTRRADLDANTNIRTYLMAAVELSLRQPEPTLIDAALILIHWGFRQRALLQPGVTDEDRTFWAEYEEYTAYMQQNQVASTVNRFWEFLRYHTVRAFIAPYRSTLKLVEWMNAGAVVVADLRTRLPPREGELLGNILMAGVVNAYGLRHSGLLDGDTGRPWFIAADEFHRLAPAPFAELITQGRYFRTYPFVAHQDDSQLSETDKSIAAALAHAPVDLSLYRSQEDLAKLERTSADKRMVAEVKKLRRFQAYLRRRTNEGTETMVIDLPADDRTDSASQWAMLMQRQDDPAQDSPGRIKYTYRPDEIPRLGTWLDGLPDAKPRGWDQKSAEERHRILSATKKGDDHAEETTADTAPPGAGEASQASGADQSGPEPLGGGGVSLGDDPAGRGGDDGTAQLPLPLRGAGGAPLLRPRGRRGD
jgi:hypothetical protein